MIVVMGSDMDMIWMVVIIVVVMMLMVVDGCGYVNGGESIGDDRRWWSRDGGDSSGDGGDGKWW